MPNKTSISPLKRSVASSSKPKKARRKLSQENLLDSPLNSPYAPITGPILTEHPFSPRPTRLEYPTRSTPTAAFLHLTAEDRTAEQTMVENISQHEDCYAFPRFIVTDFGLRVKANMDAVKINYKGLEVTFTEEILARADKTVFGQPGYLSYVISWYFQVVVFNQIFSYNTAHQMVATIAGLGKGDVVGGGEACLDRKGRMIVYNDKTGGFWQTMYDYWCKYLGWEDLERLDSEVRAKVQRAIAYPHLRRIFYNQLPVDIDLWMAVFDNDKSKIFASVKINCQWERKQGISIFYDDKGRIRQPGKILDNKINAAPRLTPAEENLLFGVWNALYPHRQLQVKVMREESPKVKSISPRKMLCRSAKGFFKQYDSPKSFLRIVTKKCKQGDIQGAQALAGKYNAFLRLGIFPGKKKVSKDTEQIINKTWDNLHRIESF